MKTYFDNQQFEIRNYQTQKYNFFSKVVSESISILNLQSILTLHPDDSVLHVLGYLQLIIDTNLFTVEHICLVHCKGKLDHVSAHPLWNHFIPKKTQK